MKINKTLSTLALISVITLSGCNEETNPTDNSDIQVNATTLSSEEAKLVEEYIKPTTNQQGKVIEAIDPLVQLLSE